MFETISQMKNNKAPGPDGFPSQFYKKCWHIIKGDLLPMFHDLFSGRLQLFHLNFGTITLVPKKTEVVKLSSSGRSVFSMLVSKFSPRLGQIGTCRLRILWCSTPKLLSCRTETSLKGLSSFMKHSTKSIRKNLTEWFSRWISRKRTIKTNGHSFNRPCI